MPATTPKASFNVATLFPIDHGPPDGGTLAMTLRSVFRLCWLAGEILRAFLDYFFRVAFVSAAGKRTARAAWMQRAARRHLRIFNFTVAVTGAIPRSGLFVSNHLSYMDILVICSVTPAAFVSKADVRGWPVFGRLATLGGTVFVERERRLVVGEVNTQIQSALDSGVLVVIFPEGTSTDGQSVLPFRSSLLEPVAGGTHAITVGRLAYSLPAGEGDAGQEVCYWGDHVFAKHLLNLTRKRAVRASIRFAPFGRASGDRKELARQLHEAVGRL